MKINYDKDADAIYIEICKGIAKNRKVDDYTILDLDKEGNTPGIELLEVSKRFPEGLFSEIPVEEFIATAH